MAEERPSFLFDPGCKWGIRRSSPYKKTMPMIKPPAAGIQPVCPEASASSMAGIRRLQTEAAIMTPAAKPKRIFCVLPLIARRNKNTIAAPATVMRNVKPVPANAQCNAWIILLLCLTFWFSPRG